ncbi:MAG: NUDIX domain-containing protein [Candidatus Roizmanbacteria bacterium]|nr:NUDIX domain-containing protein [Candidatus Roizmanbacteria bacterium]
MHKQITVILGVCVKNNKLLLIQRHEPECPDAHMKWEFPGGKFDFGETIEEAVIRECKEETGIAVAIKTLLPYTQVSYWNYQWGTQQTLLLFYLCEFIRQEKVQKDHHVNTMQWVPLPKVHHLETLPGIKEVLAYL